MQASGWSLFISYIYSIHNSGSWMFWFVYCDSFLNLACLWLGLVLLFLRFTVAVEVVIVIVDVVLLDSATVSVCTHKTFIHLHCWLSAEDLVSTGGWAAGLQISCTFPCVCGRACKMPSTCNVDLTKSASFTASFLWVSGFSEKTYGHCQSFESTSRQEEIPAASKASLRF